MSKKTLAAPPAHLTAFTWRAAQYADIQAIQNMLADNREINRSESLPTEERLRAVLGMLGDQLDTNTLIAIAGDGPVAADAQNPTGALRLYEKHGFAIARESIHFVKQLN